MRTANPSAFLFVLALLSSMVVIAPAQGQSPPPAATQPADLPWAVQLGLRVQQVDAAFPLIDRVVLVPDTATYVDELAKWSPQGRWPVLIEDDRFTPLFVRRFAPAQLIRRASVDRPLPTDSAAMQALLERVVTHTFSGKPDAMTFRDLFGQMKYAPPGIVIASAKDPAWTAAVALAAGRGQPLMWMNDDFGSPNDELSDEQARSLIAAVEQRLKGCGWHYDVLGDEIEGITICRDIGGRAKIKLPPITQVDAAGGPLAMTDLLGRRDDGKRYAFAGWIFGSSTRSAYMAMCSLFLPRKSVTLCNTYPEASDWATYSAREAADILLGKGYTVTELAGQSASDVAWQRLLIGGVSTDVFIMNSKGNADFFDMSSGRQYFVDVPVLNQPTALHLIHSWSMQSPANADSVGGRWLDHGAYCAIGSCWEPFLGAFMTPRSLVQRMVSFVPFVVSARYWDNEGPFSKPWRVNAIGDPLMLCAPPGQAEHPRIAQADVGAGTDLKELVKTLMREASTDGSAVASGDAMHILDMLGRDEIAVQFWGVAQSKGQGKFAARAALGPLFRTRNVPEFLNAWNLLPVRDSLASDMLWHLLQTRLGPAVEKETLLQLQASIRQPYAQVDLERLAPSLFKVFGKAHTREVIEREIKRSDNGAVKQKFLELANKY